MSGSQLDWNRSADALDPVVDEELHRMRKRTHNPKREISATPDAKSLTTLAKKIRYVGSPFHKRNPGDFGLVPPAQPRPDKTLCDGVQIFERQIAQNLL